MILYFTTQSNVIAQVDAGILGYADVERWLDKELSPFFPADDSSRQIGFGNWVRFIQRIDRPVERDQRIA